MHRRCLINSSDMPSPTHKQPDGNQIQSSQNVKEHLSILFIGHVGQFRQFACVIKVSNDI